MISHIHRTLLLISGWLCVALGVIGIFLPLLPTTPFLLVSAYCFSRSSPRLHAWLLANPYLGPIISDWEDNGVITLRIKWIATISMLLLISYPLIFMIQLISVRLLILTVIVCVLVFIWSRPSEPEKPQSASSTQDQARQAGK